MLFYKKNKDRDAALLTLAVQEKRKKNACPDISELAAFVDTRHSQDERIAMLEHLDACSDCYQVWLELCVEKERKKNLWPRISAFGSVAAAVLILIFWYSAIFLPGKSDMLKKSFQMAAPGIVALDSKSDMAWGFPWEEDHQRYGFADKAAITNDSLAFGAGLWDARMQLGIKGSQAQVPTFLRNQEKSDTSLQEGWRKTQWEDYYQLGRLTFLLKAVCSLSLDMPRAFWKNQDENFKNLMISIEEKEIGSVIVKGPMGKSIDSVIGNLKLLSLGKEKTQSMRKMVKDLNVIIALLGPDHPPMTETDKG